MYPYQPPTAAVPALVPEGFSVPSVLATRSARLGGAVIDGMLNFLAMLPMVVGILQSPAQLPLEGNAIDLLTTGTGGYITLVIGLSLMAIQAFLITRRGQSIGKIIVRTRIERTDGRPAGFIRGVVLRSWILVVLHSMPLPEFLITAVSVCDALFIFRKDRRCLHDWIADTRVVQVLP